jgi:DNA-binding CsgD family transcriptional regulator
MENRRVRDPLDQMLKAPDERPAELLLLSGKSLAVGGNISEAVEIFERVLSSTASNSRIAADALDWLSWLSWIELDGKRTEQYARRMIMIETPTTSPEAFRLFVRKATQSLQLGDARTALRVLEEAEQVSRDADIDSFATYLMILSDVYAALGQPKTGLGYAQLAVDIAKRRPDKFGLWRHIKYLAYIQYANSLLEDALHTFISAEELAHSASLTWEVPFSRARAAWMAALLGRFERARELIWSSFGSLEQVRWMVVTRAAVGLEIGLATGDDQLVQRCGDRAYLNIALESGDLYTLGRTAGAFFELLIRRGETVEATRLLQRVVPRLHSPDCAWSLLAPVAAYGDAPLIEHAKVLLATFPTEHSLAKAYRLLFSSVLAARTGDQAASARFAGDAQIAFEENQYHYQAARCLELAGRLGEAHQRYLKMGASYDGRRTAEARQRRGRPPRGYELGRQRREILDLLLTGETIKAIAERLGVSVRTVKTRVAEIYDFEGVSNRSELKALKKS